MVELRLDMEVLMDRFGIHIFGLLKLEQGTPGWQDGGLVEAHLGQPAGPASAAPP